MTTVEVACCAVAAGGGVLSLLAVLAGLVYPAGTVRRMVASVERERDNCRMELGFWREAALSCSSAVASLDAQLKIARQLIGGNGEQ